MNLNFACRHTGFACRFLKIKLKRSFLFQGKAKLDGSRLVYLVATHFGRFSMEACIVNQYYI